MASEQKENPKEDAFPPTDFREFINSNQGASASGNRFFDSMTPYRLGDALSLTTDLENARRAVPIVEALLEKHRDLDTHYGWVLASDAALVYKSMGGKSNRGAVWARQWMKSVHEEYERVGRALRDAKLELQILLRRAKGK